ncbi:hypothetical protein P175DRAFT_0530449 [Aspergillus ochraceoroseus IBT 24754]|uniref:Uncharacterized protein n=1 Tax=Aspergillus ochraceoroseus IBT 24754 TaxID=1392256 RepID=A0A2T5M482_9EURO|nr:uncharacterized protein P175DRAFT_0530449 [Aspergillus ochraceoroseus IBT 24754]PTU23341.1 hypothetical protein P175DRAFT_0530449 [Aspergillus ochraceoroseus IBT 24754]
MSTSARPEMASTSGRRRRLVAIIQSVGIQYLETIFDILKASIWAMGDNRPDPSQDLLSVSITTTRSLWSHDDVQSSAD